ncbi:MAG: hypothetical protein AAGA31_16620 [Bacteroidota bacterium]
MQPFDHFIAIDWSSRASPSPAKPSRNAIWLAQASATGKVSAKYFRTRAACSRYLEKRLRTLAKAKKRVFIGWDFTFGYPKGLAHALKMKKKPAWRRVWRLLAGLIHDKPNNHNNRFSVGAELNRRITSGSGPFWGVPIGQSGIFLGSKKDFSYPVFSKRATLVEKRLVEKRVPKMQPGWKLAYAGSVGSQALLGIPRVLMLSLGHDTLKPFSRIWPFQTKFAKKIPESGTLLVHAEIYPSLLEMPGKDRILDREQVRTYVKWLQKEQADNRFKGWLAGPQDLSKKQRKQVIRHEGWVLGVK